MAILQLLGFLHTATRTAARTPSFQSSRSLHPELYDHATGAGCVMPVVYRPAQCGEDSEHVNGEDRRRPSYGERRDDITADAESVIMCQLLSLRHSPTHGADTGARHACVSLLFASLRLPIRGRPPRHTAHRNRRNAPRHAAAICAAFAAH